MTTDVTTATKGTGQYADVNGISLYYEIHGDRPAADPAPRRAWVGRDVRAAAAGARRGRQVIAVDLQGHGRTADIDRPIRRPSSWPTTSRR